MFLLLMSTLLRSFATVKDFPLLHEVKIYSESKTTPWTRKGVLSLDLSKVTITLQAKALDLSFGIQQVFRIHQYLQHEQYALWEVIEFGDSYKVPPKETAKDKGLAGEVSASTKKKGRTVAITAEDMQKRRNDIDDDDIEEMDIKWNLSLLSMRADRFWKKIGKKITIQGSDITKESRQREERKSYKKDPKVEEPAPKAMIAIYDGEEVPTEYALMANSSSSSDNELYDDSFYFKSCRKNTKNLNTKISKLNEELSDCETDLYNYKRAHSNVKRPFERKSAAKIKFEFQLLDQKFPLLAQKFLLLSQQLLLIRETREKLLRPQLVGFGNLSKILLVKGIPQDNTDDKGYWDSGYSRHMTGNISYLSEYEPFNRGYVSFGNRRRKITGKDFKLVDDKHVLLRTPRQKNMYTIDLKNVVHHKNLTCQIANASVDESMLWHRRFSWTFFLKSKDETSRILRNFITEIENLKDLNVKIIRSDNEGEFRNKETDELCSRKGIKREFSNARTPQQNGVAERRNKTLIKAARTMLADAKLPVTFWAKAVNTACYIQNRVLVIKPHNKTSYELFNKRSPSIGFLRPFVCHVMILNTLDHLGKFDAKGDKGYSVGYSLSSKAFRVFNKRTKKIEENLHVDFLENRSIEKELVLIGCLILFHEVQMATLNVAAMKNDAIPDNNAPQKEQEEVNGDKEVPESSGNSNPTSSTKVSSNDLFELASSSTVETKVSTVCTPILTGNAMLFENRLEAFQVSPNPTLIIHKDHPKSYIIGPIDTLFQTRQKTKNMDEQSFIAIIHQKTNPDLLQYFLFSCFLSQEEPKKIVDALKDPSWVEAMQQELLQIKIQNVWVLVDCPKWEEGIDYEEVFAPVARIEAIRLFLAYASYMGFTVYQMDVKSAFLYGTIDEEVYVIQPHGFQDPEFPHRVYKDGIGKDAEVHLYRSMIGSLMYLTTSRLDVMFVVCACARHQVTPKECHLHVFKRIFRYLKGHPKLGLWYHKESPFDLVAYSESDYGGAKQDRESTTGGCQFLRRRLISWQCKKQTIMATSATKAEYVAADKHVMMRLMTATIICTNFGGNSGNSANGLNMDPMVNMCLNFLHGSDSEQWTREFMHIYLVSKTKHNTDFHQIVDFLKASHIRIITRGTIRISRSKVLSPRADETAFPTGDVRYREAFLTVTRLDAGQGRENIVKTFVIPHEASPRVTSLGGGEIRLAQEDAPNTRGMDQREYLLVGDTAKDSDKSADKGSDSTDEMSNVLGTLGATNILASGGLRLVFTTASLSVATASIVVSPAVATASGSFPTAVIFTTTKLDRSNEIVVKYLSEYEQAEVGLSHDEKVELIDVLLMYQRNLAQIKKYQAQQNKPATKTERRNFYMSILRSNAGWKVKDFKGMTFKQIEEKLIPVWEKMQDFVPMNSKLESKRLKRPGIQLGKESFKKLKTVEVSEKVYIEALQVKYPIIDREIYSEGLRKYWKIIRVGNHIEVYQIFNDMLKKFDRENLDRLWSLVKETCSTIEVTDEKEKDLWVELKRLYEPDSRDPL
nr:hypothetical protein [Tanacetum cinerariifolium]